MDHVDAIVRASNLTWAPADLNDCFEGIPISKSVQCGRLASSSTQTIAVATDASRGGNVAFIPVNRTGHYAPDLLPSLQCHASAVTDLMWSPTANNLLATASWDRTVRLWGSISPETRSKTNSSSNSASVSSSPSTDGREKSPPKSQAPAVKLAELAHIDRVVCVAWNPLSSELLASAVHSQKAMIWDVSVSGCTENVQIVRSPLQMIKLSASVCDFSWAPDSHNNLLASACRDKRLYLHDPRSPPSRKRSTGSVASWICHRSSKPWKICFLDERTIASVGFGEEGGREVAVWNLSNTAAPLQRFQCDQSSGGIILHYYLETHHLFLSGRGDNSLRIFAFSNNVISLVDRFQSPHPYRDICWMPQAGLNSAEGEIARCFRLFVPDSALVLAASGRRSDFSSTNQWAEPGSSVSPTGQSPPIRNGGGGNSGRGVYRHTNSPLIEPLSVYRSDLLRGPCATANGATEIYNAQSEVSSKEPRCSFKKISTPKKRQIREPSEQPPIFAAKVAPPPTSSSDSTSTLTFKSDFGRSSYQRQKQQPQAQKTHRRQRIYLASGSAIPCERKAPFSDSRRRCSAPQKTNVEVNTSLGKIKQPTQTPVSNKINVVEKNNEGQADQSCPPVRPRQLRERVCSLDQKAPLNGRNSGWKIERGGTAYTSPKQESKPCPASKETQLPSRMAQLQRRKNRRGIKAEALCYPKDYNDSTDVGDSVWESEEAGVYNETSPRPKNTADLVVTAERRRWVQQPQLAQSFGGVHSAEQDGNLVVEPGTSPRMSRKKSHRKEYDEATETCSVSDLVAVFEAKLNYQDTFKVFILESKGMIPQGRSPLPATPLVPATTSTSAAETHIHTPKSQTVGDMAAKTQPTCARRYKVQRTEQSLASPNYLSPALRYMQRASTLSCNLISPLQFEVSDGSTRKSETSLLARDKRLKTASRRQVLTRRSRRQSVVRRPRLGLTEGQLLVCFSDVAQREDANKPSGLSSPKEDCKPISLVRRKLDQSKMTYSEKLEVTPYLPLLTVSDLFTQPPPPASTAAGKQIDEECRSEHALTPDTLQRIFRSTREFYYKYTPSLAQLTKSLGTSDIEHQVEPSRISKNTPSGAEPISILPRIAMHPEPDGKFEAVTANGDHELAHEDHGGSTDPTNRTNSSNRDVQSKNLDIDRDLTLLPPALTFQTSVH